MRSCFLLSLLPALCITTAYGVAPSSFTLRTQTISEYRISTLEGGECQIHFTLSGDHLQDALEAGKWQIEEASDDTGNSLKLLSGYENHFRPLQPHSTPKAGAAVLKLGLSTASRSARFIRILKGSVGIRIYRRQIVILPEVQHKRNTLIENPLFKAHGFTVQVTDPQHAFPGYTTDQEKSTLLRRAVALRIEGEIDRVDSISLTTADGTAIPSHASGFGAGRSRMMALMADEPIPEDAAIHLLIPIDPKEIRIPFSFTDIPLP